MATIWLNRQEVHSIAATNVVPGAGRHKHSSLVRIPETLIGNVWLGEDCWIRQIIYKICFDMYRCGGYNSIFVKKHQPYRRIIRYWKGKVSCVNFVQFLDKVNLNILIQDLAMFTSQMSLLTDCFIFTKYINYSNLQRLFIFMFCCIA